MKPKVLEEKIEKVLKQKSMIHIVGSNQLQNDLLSRFVKDEIGVAYEIIIYNQSVIDISIDEAAAMKHLILVDCLDIDIAQLWAGFSIGEQKNDSKKFIALFNVDPDKGVERQAVDHGIRGVFYRNDPVKMLSRGIIEIFNGELWYSRKTMSEYLLQNRSISKFSEDTVSSLTFREREILIGVASGASNKDLAEDLGISLHTVKTHIYNIYKKINVPNRLQAALWAAQYL